MTITIRPAAETDLRELLPLYAELNPDDAPLSADSARSIWTAIRHQQGRTVLVAELDSTLAGTADCTVLPNLTRGGRSILVVENVVVTHTHRRLGVGKQLMDAAARLAESTGCYKIQLLAADSHEAHTFYQACGFQPLAQGFRRYLRQEQSTSQPGESSRSEQ
ncbi:GNAT family N-acetyltransferase [Streptomyces paludis]|uniref:GNAT family N-acetyltransferase n=1 Tax=Streptomyces paludis TaxID=2282738 RepID=A0A345HT50_9ACTN|nr:GNAT family N-acetyltransferase [Streptomyces paludis]AXG79874.1 GNAT family N-acetyltransferase [Streptomyces paludis]